MKITLFKGATGLGRSAALIAVGSIAATQVQAAEFMGIDFSLSGLIRLETAIKTDSQENPYNQRGNIFNGKEVEREGGLPLGGLPLPVTVNDTATRNGEQADNEFNFAQLRFESTLQMRITDNISGTIKMRGVYDAAVYDEFDPDKVDSQADGYLYGEPNYFEYDDFHKGGAQNRTEIVGENYMVDFPSIYFDYQNGPLLIRAGNQQIAWGQALFFRAFDVANGLDLRRHLILDFASEEYADERISSPAIRVSYQVTSNWELDVFAQQFQPSILPNPNTPYNVVASQFTVHDRYSDVRDKIISGVRFKGFAGDLGLQFMYTNRYNQDGTFRWTKSGVNRDAAAVPGSGAILAETPLEVDPTGVWSAEEWFTYAAMARLDGTEGLNRLIEDFPESQNLGAMPVSSKEAAEQELDLFFQLSGSGFRGHIERTYHREDIFGLGASYVFSGKPGSWLDQLIVNFEVAYTPERHFTPIDLGQEYIVEEEYISALVMEKYQRFSRSFPATYIVFQWMHRTESDLFGRHLSGMGGTEANTPKGVDSWDGLVLALQQPFPGLVWRADFSLLYDTQGGLLAQPALKWKPSGNWNVEFFYTHLDGEVGADANSNIIQTIDWADEFGLRIAYQF